MSKVNVFLTIDTEHSIGGAFGDPNLKPVGNEKRIFGLIGNKQYGIPLIMDIADRYGIPITFFVEVFNKYFFGAEETREVCNYILNRNHDIQLHIHPNYLNFELDDPTKLVFSDLIGDYSLSRQAEIIEEAKEALINYGVSSPIAFRAGCFGADENTIKALRRTGFLIDSSYNTAYLENPCLLPDIEINDLAPMHGVWEFPITNFIEHSGLRPKRCMPLDINGVSFAEMRWVLRHAASDGPMNITIILHSFSFVKAYDVQYRKTRPRKNVIRRFERLCAFLAGHSDHFRVMTFGCLDHAALSNMSGSTNHALSVVPPFLSLVRAVGQMQDRII